LIHGVPFLQRQVDFLLLKRHIRAPSVNCAYEQYWNRKSWRTTSCALRQAKGHVA
jgi:hypothetical protein